MGEMTVTAEMRPLSECKTSLAEFMRSDSLSNPVLQTMAKCLRDFTATKPDELSFEEDDFVTIVTSECTRPKHLYGSLYSKNGWFPAEYVKLLTTAEWEAENAAEEKLAGSWAAASRGSYSTLERDSQEEIPQQRSWYQRYRSSSRYEKKASTSNFTDDYKRERTLSSVDNIARTSPPIVHLSGNMELTATPLEANPTIKKSSTSLESAQVTKTSRMPGQRQLWVDIMGGLEKVQASGLTKLEIKRQEVILEIITTESDYVEDLEIICELYLKPLRANKLIRPKDMSIIFSNLEIILGVNQELLKSLDQRQSENFTVEKVGDIFIRVVNV